jgi:hypothetical protein
LSYRISQLSPQSTHGLNWKVAVHGPWSDRPENLREAHIWRSWLELDSQYLEEAEPRSRVNWNAIAGIGIVMVLCAGFWAGIGWLVARLLN